MNSSRRRPRSTIAISTFRNPPFDPAPVTGGDLFKNPSLKSVAPRVGFAWNVTGDGKTAVRGGSGIFYEPILANIYRTFGNRTPPFFYQASLSNPPFPRAVVGELPTNQQRLDLLEFDLDNPYMWQYNLTVQRELMPQLSVMVGYIGSRGYELFRNVESNQAIPVIQSDGSYFFPVRQHPPLTAVGRGEAAQNGRPLVVQRHGRERYQTVQRRAPVPGLVHARPLA